VISLTSRKFWNFKLIIFLKYPQKELKANIKIISNYKILSETLHKTFLIDQKQPQTLQ
jgi:hypothetical protein